MGRVIRSEKQRNGTDFKLLSKQTFVFFKSFFEVSLFLTQVQCIQDSIFHFVRCLSAEALDGGIATAFYYCVSSRLPVSTHGSVGLGRRDFLDDQIRDPPSSSSSSSAGHHGSSRGREGGREGGSMAGHMDRERHEETGGRKQERVHVWNRSQFLYINPFCRKECMGRAMHT